MTASYRSREVIVYEIAPHLDVAEKAEAGQRGDLLERARDCLQLGVVRGDAEPDETPRRGQPLDEIDLGSRREQRARGVEPRRPGADYGDAKGALMRVIL